MTNLYTMILDFAGGTYISQVESISAKSALQPWLRRLAEDPRTAKIASNLEVADDDDPVLLAGATNVWSTGFLTQSNDYALLNIVLTTK